MENVEQRLRDLLQSPSWTAEDKIWLKSYLDGDLAELEALAFQEYQNDLMQGDQLLPAGLSSTLLESLHRRLQIGAKPVRTLKLWPKVAAVAAAVTAMALCIYFFNANRHPGTSLSSRVSRDLNDIAPGRNGATITFANGKVIQLSGTKNGVIVGSELKYNDNTPVTSDYPSSRGNERSLDPANLPKTSTSSSRDLSQGRDDGKVQNLMASTSRGQTYQFTLPDGTKVWLNAESKIEFPSNFMNSKTRNVKLTGEAYFAVVHNAKQPFRVESKGANGTGQIVEDIGTEFNINAYTDESSVKTTLVEGSALVRHLDDRRDLLNSTNKKSPGALGMTDKGFILKPNQQAILSPAGGAGSARGGSIKVLAIDAEDATAWKNGLFIFEDEPLESIMKKVSRWYDVDVVYQQGVDKGQLYGGSVSRYDKVSKVLEGLELTKGIHFKIEGRRITVMQ